MTNEMALIRRVQRGDQTAFAELLEAYEKPVYNLCLRMTGNPEDAADMTQEAFLKVWRGIEQYKFESSFSTWVYRLTSNVCIDFLRGQVALLRPKIIVCLGRIAAKAIIKEDFKITAEHGKWFQRGGVQMTAIYHPSALLRDADKRPETFTDLKAIQAKVREICAHTEC